MKYVYLFFCGSQQRVEVANTCCRYLLFVLLMLLYISLYVCVCIDTFFLIFWCAIDRQRFTCVICCGQYVIPMWNGGMCASNVNLLWGPGRLIYCGSGCTSVTFLAVWCARPVLAATGGSWEWGAKCRDPWCMHAELTQLSSRGWLRWSKETLKAELRKNTFRSIACLSIPFHG